ncbi:glycine cleavage system protein R [Ornithinimicrobium sp. W1665]|uniref:glycine cleavage system protein R n=1 Tax=Ornithinimicrobium sp. W1665 TaxID=3416666 RepID=UPI003CED25D2
MRTQLVLTVVGDDRSGLVRALADVVDQHGGNWEESRLSELAGTFAGVVVVSVPADRTEELRAALEPLTGLLEVSVRPGGTLPAEGGDAGGTPVLVEIMGNDQPGIVRSISSVLADHGLNVAELETRTVEAPMAGGQLFEATVVATVPEGADTDALRADLERLAGEIQVEVTFSRSEDLAEG